MKTLNFTNNPKTYKELFEQYPELSVDPDDWDASKERMSFGKYTDMLLSDLLSYDSGYFNYIQNLILSDKVSSNLNTYNQRVKLLRSMLFVERQHKIERYGEEFERRQKATGQENRTSGLHSSFSCSASNVIC